METGKRKKVLETFRKVGDYCLEKLTLKEPSCFNGEVLVNKYRITIEEIKRA